MEFNDQIKKSRSVVLARPPTFPSSTLVVGQICGNPTIHCSYCLTEVILKYAKVKM